LEFLNSQPYYASKKIVIQSSDFPGTPYRLVPSQKSTGFIYLNGLLYARCAIYLRQLRFLLHLYTQVDSCVSGGVHNSHVLGNDQSRGPQQCAMDILLRYGKLYGQPAHLWCVPSAQTTYRIWKKVSKRRIIVIVIDAIIFVLLD